MCEMKLCMHDLNKYILFLFMCVHEDMKKIPARPLLIDYGLAGMGLMPSRVDSGISWSGLTLLLIDYGLAGIVLMLLRVDSGISWSGLTLLLIDYGLAGMGLMLLRIDSGVSGSPFLVLRPPFLPLMEEKEQKKIKASGTPAKLAGVDDGNGTTKS